MNWSLERRGYQLGEVTSTATSSDQTDQWHAGQACLLKGVCLDSIEQQQQNLQRSDRLYAAVLDNIEPHQLMDQPPYSEHLEGLFESLGSTVNEGDEQEIETVLFDVVKDGDLIAQDLWMKVSWLSFYDEDASLRFRFSFGMDLAEDVAADKHRQTYAAQLGNAVFPESTIISEDQSLISTLQDLLKSDEVSFVERIVYFNSPQGGAYLHHDRERGHAGVVYAQLSGQTYWLALPKKDLVNEVIDFINSCEQQQQWPSSFTSEQRNELSRLASNTEHLSTELETFANDSLIHLINETEPFVQQLIASGYGRLVETGDVILLPQENDLNCCWHSVFNLGDESGQALSFAIRGG